MRSEINRVSAARRITTVAALLSLVLALGIWHVYSHNFAGSANTAKRGTAAHQNIDVATALGRLPLSFELNKGQTDSSVRFLTRGAGYSVFFTDKEAVIQLKKAKASRSAAIAMRFVGAQKPSAIVPEGKQEGISNYYIGPKSNWVTGVPNYSRVHYKGLYPGVDAAFYGQGTKLRYDILVAKGADPSAVALSFDGATGTGLNENGDLVLKTSGGDVVYDKPVIYQQIAGVRRPVSGGYRLLGGQQVGFDVSGYDRNETLVIDPILNFSTYLGGTLADQVNAVVQNGNVYVAGQTSSLDFPLFSASAQTGNSGSWSGKNGLSDAFVAALNSTGTARSWSSYYGGSLDDSASAIAYDWNGGRIVIAGNSSSPDLPLTTCPCISGQGQHGFVASFNSGGGWVWATRVGSYDATDTVYGVAEDVNGTNDIYVAGTTSSTGLISAAGGYQSALGGTQDGFVTRLTAANGTTVQSTYVGGAGIENLRAIAAHYGTIYLGGDTTSLKATFPAFGANPIQTENAGGTDGFVAIMPSTLTAAPSYRTFLGGTGTDSVTAVGIRTPPYNFNEPKVWVAGNTTSAGLATTTGAAQGTFGGGTDGFVAYIYDTGKLGYLTYLGGSGVDTVTGIAVDQTGQAYVVGQTASPNLPVTANAVQATLSGATDGFFARVGGSPALVADGMPNGGLFSYVTYFGGAGADSINGIAVGPNNTSPIAYFGGITDGGAGLVTSPGAYRVTPVGASDGFVSSYVFNDLAITNPGTFTIASGGAAQTANLTLTFTDVPSAYTISAVTDTYAPTTGVACPGWLTATNAGAATITIKVDPKAAGCSPATGLKATFAVTAGNDNGPQVVTVMLNYTATATAPANVTRYFLKGTTLVTMVGPNPPQPVSAANTVTNNQESFLLTGSPTGSPFTATLALQGSAAQKAACNGVIAAAVTGATAASGTNVMVTYNPSAAGDLNNMMLFGGNPGCQAAITYAVPGVTANPVQNVYLIFTSRLTQVSTLQTFNFPLNAVGQASTQTINASGDALPVQFTAAVSTPLAYSSGSNPGGTCAANALSVSPGPFTAPDNLGLLPPSDVNVTVDPSFGPCALGNTYKGAVTLTPTNPAVGGNPVIVPITVVVGNAIATIPTSVTLLNLGNSTVGDTTPPASKTATVNTTIPTLPFQFKVSVTTNVQGAYAGTAIQAAGSANGWLRVSPATGDTTSGPVTITASVDPTVWATLAGSAGGTPYGGAITITSTGGNISSNTTSTITVQFMKYSQPIQVAEGNVGGPYGAPSITPAQMNFVLNVGQGGGTQSQGIQPSLTAGYIPTPLDFTVDAMTLQGPGYPGYGFPADSTVGAVTVFTGGQNPASWLSVSPIQGTAGTGVVVTANLSNLNTQSITAPVTYTGTIRIRHAGNSTNSLSGQNPVTIAVTLTVNPVLSLNLSPTLIPGFAYTLGTTPYPAPVTVTGKSSLASTSIPYTATANVTPTGTCAWLTATPASGTADSVTGAAIAIGVAPACLSGATALAPGNYAGQVTITASSASVPVQTINVALTVTALPTISIPSAFSPVNLSGTVNAPSAPAATVVPVNVAGGTAPLTLTGTQPSWLSANLSPLGVATSSASLTLQLNQTAVNLLTPGAQTPVVLTIGSTQANVLPITVTVNLTVFAQPTIISASSSQSFTYTLGNTTASTPLCGSPVAITGSSNGLVVNPVISTTNGGPNWILSPTLTGGTTPTQATFCVVPSQLSTLAAGVYTGTVSLQSPGAVSAAVGITLTVNAQPVISASATAAYAYTWSGNAPAAQALNVTATPNATGLTLASTGSCSWLTASLAGTSAPTTINTSLVQPLTLAPGTYACTLAVSGTGGAPSAPAQGSSTVVTLTVSPLAFFAPATSVGNGVSFETLAGGNLFGYFAYLQSNSLIFHFDLGYEGIVSANDGANGIYMYDFKSGHWFYTNPSSFPFLYDFTLKAWIYYFPAQGVAGHYTTNPRNFVNMTTGQFFSM